jgi:uncharacterized protein YkwD
MKVALSRPVLLVLTIFCLAQGYPGPVENRVLELANGQRRARGIRPLVWDEHLARQARLHSRRMAELGFFGHQDPKRGSLGQRIGASRRVVAENLHRSYGYNDPADVAVQGWMDSDGHRRNLLNSRFTVTGIGLARAGDGTWFATQLFAAGPY